MDNASGSRAPAGPVPRHSPSTLYPHHGPGPHPQLLDHRAHRPRQVDAGRPHPRADPHGRRAGDARAAARLDGPGARARDHDQGAGGARVLHRPRRADLPAAPDRHPRPRGLHVRGLALAGRVRGGAARRGRLPGRGGADGREHVPGGGVRAGADPVPEQDRPPRRRAGAGGRRSERADGRAAGVDPADQREDRRGRAGRAGGADRARAAPRGRPRGARAGADLRLRVRPVPRRDRLHPRGRRRVPQGRADPRDGDGDRGGHRRHRLLQPADDAHRPARGGGGGLPDHGSEGRHPAARRRHAHHAGEGRGVRFALGRTRLGRRGHRAAARLPGGEADGLLRPVPDRLGRPTRTCATRWRSWC